MLPPGRGILNDVRNPGGLSCLRSPPGSFCFQGICCGFLLDLGAIDVAYITDIGVVDLRGLQHVFRPLHALFVGHSLPDEQPQQFRRQFRNVCIPSGFGDKAAGAGDLIPPSSDCCGLPHLMLSTIRESVGVEAEPQNLPAYMKA